MRLDMPWGTLSAVDEGRGPVVVLLHSLAMSGEMWRPLIDRMRDGFRVIAPDARGHGQSTWDGEPFTVVDLAEDIAALITSLDVAPVSVLGLSMGGSTAIALATRRPELVDRLVLADTTAYYGPDREQAWRDRARVAVGMPREEQLPFQHDRWFSPGFVAAHPEEVRRVEKIFLRTESRAHAAACHALGAFDDTERLATITCPTLIVVGEDDYATPPSMAEALHAGIAGSRLEIVAGARHLSLLEDSRSWPVVLEHLRGDGR
jgi:3-oxoadipate enol-lactonase